MEIEFILFTVIILLIIWLNSLRKLNRNQALERRNNTEHKIVPFDKKSAKPETVTSIITGHAHVVDGDTIILKKTQIRLFGIDAPEINHPFGQKAKWALVSLCKGQIVKAEITQRDNYGRTVARCFLPDGRDISAEMVKLGLAIDWPKFSNGVYQTMELPDVRKKLWLADARQKGRMHVWEQFESRQQSANEKN